jgi:superfamily II DNA or RNA helicase
LAPSSLTALRAAVQEACSSRAWSQGVQLVRDDLVRGATSTTDAAGVETEISCQVKVPTRPAALTVILYPRELDWECECPTKESCCAHVAAAVIALAQAREAGTALPEPRRAGGRMAYRLEPEPGGLGVRRVVIAPDGTEQPLPAPIASIASGRVPGPAIDVTQADLLVDQLIGSRTGTISADRLPTLLTALADAPDITLRGAKVKASGEPVVPRVIVEDAPGGGATLTLVRDPDVTAVVSLGVVRCGDVLRPVGEVELQGGRLDRLPATRSFAAHQLGELLGKILPALEGRVPIERRARKLPQLTRGERPRIALDVNQKGDKLSVMATLVYGEPARARVDGDNLTHLGGDLPVRDLAAEKELLWRLRDRLDLAPGRRVELVGRDAVAFHARLGTWLRDDADAAHAAGAVAAATLEPRVDTDDGRFDVTFSTGDGRARPEDVLRAWQVGAELVPLDGGGWGRVPRAWLVKHGQRVADLLAARGDDGAVPLFALPDLAALCEDLDRPPPADVERLRPVFAGFDKLPHAEVPATVAALLRPYQRAGVDWLVFCRDLGLGCILADDMGLGKTVQALAAIRGRTLVVAPTSVVFNWADEARRFRPDLEVSTYHGARRAIDPEADLVLTTYPLLRNDIDELAAITWDTVVLDESQNIKNPDSQVARAAYRLRAGWRVTLSGTPVENRLDELWSQLHFTNPGLLGGRADFAERWAAPVAAGEPGAAARLRERIRPFVLRRLKREVAPELPPRTEGVLHVELDDAERVIYDAIRAATQRDILQLLEAGGGGSVMAALEALLRLRQAACHSALIPGQSADGSSKVTRLLGALEDAAADGHKALVFSQWTSLLDLVEPHLEAEGIAYTRLDGQTTNRGEVVARFQDPAGPPVMLISLKAGGTGLNLTAADHVFLLDPWWNPAVEDQAADRAHRIGQDKPVFVYRLVARDTVEERILALQAQKRALADAALGEADRAASLTRDDLLALLA